MERCILVPLDGSVLAETALPHALALAQTNGSTLYLVRVVTSAPPVAAYEWPVPPVVSRQEWILEEEHAAITYLNALKQQFAESGTSIRVGVFQGEPARVIIDLTEAHRGINMIVMASHGRKGFSRWLLGSVAEKILHATPVPLLIVHGTEQPTPSPIKPVVYQHVMVPLDGSSFAEQAITAARLIAKLHQAPITLASVIPPEDDIGLAEAGVIPMWSIKDQQANRERITQYIKRMAAMVERTGLQVNYLVETGDPVQTLESIASRDAVDLIVMATHGRSGFSRMWLGSVATRLIRHTTHQVLLVRAQEHYIHTREVETHVAENQSVEIGKKTRMPL